MLIGKKCVVKNFQFGKVNCPKEFADVESFEGVIVEGPNHNQSENNYDYSFLVLMKDGRLFSTSYRYVTIPEQPIFK